MKKSSSTKIYPKVQLSRTQTYIPIAISSSNTPANINHQITNIDYYADLIENGQLKKKHSEPYKRTQKQN